MPKKLVVWLPLTLGEAIKLMRTRAKWTRRNLAKQADLAWAGNQNDDVLDVDTITRLEADDPEIELSKIVAVGEALGYHFHVNVKLNPHPPEENVAGAGGG
jgi:transcriptional regulator with XRE-family HTH domain